MSQSANGTLSSLERLSISKSRQSASAAKDARGVADSWEEEDDDDNNPSSEGSDTETEEGAEDESGHGRSSSARGYPDAPPPTPASPTATFSHHDRGGPVEFRGFDNAGRPMDFRDESGGGGQGQGGPSRRPEKTTAAAGRMIAGALGVRAPARSEEQKAYDKAVREKELRRREREREEKAREKQAESEAKRAVWED